MGNSNSFSREHSDSSHAVEALSWLWSSELLLEMRVRSVELWQFQRLFQDTWKYPLLSKPSTC